MEKITQLQAVLCETRCECGGAYNFSHTSRNSRDGSKVYNYECENCHKEISFNQYYVPKLQKLYFLDNETNTTYGLIGDDLRLIKVSIED